MRKKAQPVSSGGFILGLKDGKGQGLFLKKGTNNLLSIWRRSYKGILDKRELLYLEFSSVRAEFVAPLQAKVDPHVSF